MADPIPPSGFDTGSLADVEQYRQTLAYTDQVRQDAYQFAQDLQYADALAEGFAFTRTQRAFDRHLGLMHKSLELLNTRSKSEIQALNQQWSDWGHEFDRHMMQARRGLDWIGGESGLGLSGGRGVYASVRNQYQGFLSQLPMGGLLGVMLYGAKREQEFETSAFRALRVMDQLTGFSTASVKTLTTQVKDMHEAWGSSGEEAASVLAAFAQNNISSDKAFQDLGISAGRFGSSLKDVVMGLEAAYKLQPGSLAGKIGAVFASGAEDADAVTREYIQLAGVAETAKVNVDALFSSMTQGAGALRLQRQGVDDLSLGFLKLSDAFRKSRRYATDEAAGDAAMRGVQAAASGLSGMSEGLMGYLGEESGGRSGVDAIVAMKEGLYGKRSEYAGTMFRRLARLAREVTGNGSRAERIYALEKIMPSLGFEGSRAVIDMERGKGTMADVRDAMKSPEQKLLEAFQKRAQEESEWEKIQRRVLLGIATSGTGLLQVMTGIAQFLAADTEAEKEAAKKNIRIGGEQFSDMSAVIMSTIAEAYTSAGDPKTAERFRLISEQLEEQRGKRRIQAYMNQIPERKAERERRDALMTRSAAHYHALFENRNERETFEYENFETAQALRNKINALYQSGKDKASVESTVARFLKERDIQFTNRTNAKIKVTLEPVNTSTLSELPE